MFYSHDLLSRRKSRFGAIWILANANAPTSRRLGYITNREIAGIDIPRSCLDILRPPVPLSLRLSSTLLVGLAQALKRKASLLYTETHTARSQIASMPSIASIHGFDPLISCALTTASWKSITLSVDTVPIFIDCQTGSLCEPFSEHHKALGWFRDRYSSSNLESGASAGSGFYLDKSKCASVSYSQDLVDTSKNTALWDTISIADSIIPRNDTSLAYHAQQDISNNISTTADILNMSSIQCNADPVGSRDYFDLHLGANSNSLEQEFNVYFGENGDLQFIPSSDPANVSYQQVQGMTGLVLNQNNNVSSDFLQMGPEAMGFGEYSQCNVQSISSCLENTGLHLGTTAQSLLCDQTLEEAENEIIGTWGRVHQAGILTTRCVNGESACKKRCVTKQLAELADTHSVLELSSGHSLHCLDMSDSRNHYISIKKDLSVQIHRIQTATKYRVARASKIYCSTEAVPAMHLFVSFSNDMSVPDVEQADKSSEVSFADSLAHVIVEDYESSGLVNIDIDPEQVRAGSPQLVGPDPGIEDLYLDIPWLNPTINQANLDKRIQGSRPASVSIEASCEPSASIQDTPNSQLHAYGPPSSEDGLDIQSFELAQHEPEMQAEDFVGGNIDYVDNHCDQHGLESFLSTSNDIVSSKEKKIESDMDLESRSFKRFVLSRIIAQDMNVISFEDLLIPSYRTHRVAARAFIDLLQMASRSEFNVVQYTPFSTIFILQKSQ